MGIRHILHLLISIAAFLSHPTINYIVTYCEEFPLHSKNLSAYVQMQQLHCHPSLKYLGASIKALQL